MADEARPHLGPAGGRLAEPPVRGEPKGPRPPVFETVEAPGRKIDNALTPEQTSNVAESAVPPHATGPEVPVRGFHGGVEHSQEMRAARQAEGDQSSVAGAAPQDGGRGR